MFKKYNLVSPQLNGKTESINTLLFKNGRVNFEEYKEEFKSKAKILRTTFLALINLNIKQNSAKEQVSIFNRTLKF